MSKQKQFIESWCKWETFKTELRERIIKEYFSVLYDKDNIPVSRSPMDQIMGENLLKLETEMSLKFNELFTPTYRWFDEEEEDGTSSPEDPALFGLNLTSTVISDPINNESILTGTTETVYSDQSDSYYLIND